MLKWVKLIYNKIAQILNGIMHIACVGVKAASRT